MSRHRRAQRTLPPHPPRDNGAGITALRLEPAVRRTPRSPARSAVRRPREPWRRLSWTIPLRRRGGPHDPPRTPLPRLGRPAQPETAAPPMPGRRTLVRRQPDRHPRGRRPDLGVPVAVPDRGRTGLFPMPRPGPPRGEPPRVDGPLLSTFPTHRREPRLCSGRSRPGFERHAPRPRSGISQQYCVVIPSDRNIGVVSSDPPSRAPPQS